MYFSLSERGNGEVGGVDEQVQNHKELLVATNQSRAVPDNSYHVLY
jgi:hypothetical protein